MNYSHSVMLAGVLLCSSGPLSAQSAPRPTVAAVAGCYTLTLGPWQQHHADGASGWEALPSVIRLDDALVASVPGWRRLSPGPGDYSAKRGIGPAWRVSATDSVEAFWSTGFAGTGLMLAVHGDTLIGSGDVAGIRRDAVAM